LSNHPKWGGAHLPDLTVITKITIDGTKFYLANRGHHADIGGSRPGSMPAFSKSLS
jgi:5-oxoprolinase (ATP-hydrolysing)